MYFKRMYRKVYDKKIRKLFCEGYLTVWIALCLTVILSLCLTLIDGARRNAARMEIECIANIGLQSILAEYHRELMKQYNLFAIDASYGTSICNRFNTEARLRYYLEQNLSYDDIFLSEYLYGNFLSLALKQVELKKISILTDNQGELFRKRAAEAMGADIGLDLLWEIQKWVQVIEVNGLEDGTEEDEKRQLDKEIESFDGMEIEIEEDQWETLVIDNPTDKLEEKKREGILKLVLSEEEEVSQKILNMENLLEFRMEQGHLNHGNIKQEALSEVSKVMERFLFQEYLLQYMGRYTKEKENSALQYQMEYLISGNDSDMDNLRSIANRICVVREAANVLYLMSSGEKMSEVRLAAELVCTIITLPELTPLLEAAIVLGWAYAESIYDVKSIMAGGKIPLLKDDDSWHYGLAAALEGELQEVTQEGEGLSYEDYLRVLMMMTDLDTITVRAMNMVEADIRNTAGNTAFRLDGCYDRVEAYIRVESAQGIVYEITRQMGYN